MRGGLSSGVTTKLARGTAVHCGGLMAFATAQEGVTKGGNPATHRQAQELQSKQFAAGILARFCASADAATGSETAIVAVRWCAEGHSIDSEAIESQAQTGATASADRARTKYRTRTINRMERIRERHRIVGSAGLIPLPNQQVVRTR